tara:strand:+ start:311 stop:1714 length:1404 start_codon:yes stop_codon:yes gene_type:complete
MMAKISLIFKTFDIGACIKELGVDSLARSDASYGMPAAEATTFTTAENLIEQRITSFYGEAVPNSNSAALEESLQNAASLRQADGHEGQISTLKSSLRTLLIECKSRLSSEFETAKRDKDYLEFFRRDNDLVAKADLKSGQQKTFSAILILAMFAFEVGVNTSLMSGAISGGTKATIAIAGVIAFINIGASFMFGRIILPNLYHKVRSKVWLGRLGMLFYAPLIIYINFALGVFRSLSENKPQSFSSVELENVALLAAWPFDNMTDMTFASNGLIMIGLLFAIISILDGFHFDEPYPGYGKVSKLAKDSEARFADLKKEGFDLLYAKQNEGNTQITKFKNDREEANKTWANNIDSVQLAFNEYEDWVKGLTKAGNNLLQHYRSINKSYRTSEVPQYFSETHDFGFEYDAANRFRSLVASNLSDMEKDEQFTVSNKVIINEYNGAITELNNIYEGIIDGYENFLGGLK